MTECYADTFDGLRTHVIKSIDELLNKQGLTIVRLQMCPTYTLEVMILELVNDKSFDIYLNHCSSSQQPPIPG